MIPFPVVSRKISKVFIHCSASDSPAHDSVSVVKAWHTTKGWSDIGYHFFITKHGVIQLGRPLDKIPAAQKGHNTGSIAICLHGLDKDLFTDRQAIALYELCAAIDQSYDVTFHGHCEVANKTCPVIDYKGILNLDDYGRMLGFN